MKAFACRLLGAGRCDVSLVLADTIPQLFWHLDEICNPYQFEIVKLSNTDTGVINLAFIKKYDSDVEDEHWELQEENSCDHTTLVGDLADMFETRQRYRLESHTENGYSLIKLNKKEMPFG